MKTLRSCLLVLLLSLISNKVYQQTIEQKNNLNGLTGQYKSPNGLQFFVNVDGSFYILKRHNKTFDAVLPGCDTIAKGEWKLFRESIIRLSNYDSYKEVKFQVTQEKRLSGDTVYLKFDLPKDDAFFDGKFRYQVTVMGKIDFLETTNSILTIPKKKIFDDGNLYYHLGLTIQDLSPLNCERNGKCNQRIYFNIFNDYTLKTTANFFTVKLNGFNDCYVERTDVDNEYVYFTKNVLHWRNIDFIKPK